MLVNSCEHLTPVAGENMPDPPRDGYNAVDVIAKELVSCIGRLDFLTTAKRHYYCVT